MKNFIQRMYGNNFFIKDGIIYDNADGCSKQYIHANEMWILSALELTYRVTIDRCINSTGHRRRKLMVLMDLARHT